MNGKGTKRGLTNSRLLAAIAVSTLLLNSGDIMAAPTAEGSISEVTQQLQTINVKGVVVDVQGQPVIGASVLEKGTTNGGVTDINGNFILNVKSGAILQISYVGYRNQEVKAEKTMKIVLREDTELLSEVVVVGYGTQKKENLTGAVTTVDVSKTLEGRPQQDVAKALQGAVPGLSIVSSSGNINNNPTIRIRGLGTLSNDKKSAPLIVVDGVPMDDISFLNAQDIESISVLKDAASSSIYGTRAAFGVILVKTKSAKSVERVSVTYSNNFAWDQATFLPDYPDVPTQLRAAIDAKKRAGSDAVELFGMYFDQMLPYAEAWKAQHKGKAGYREMVPFESMDKVGDYYMDPTTGRALYYADWDVKKIFYNDATPSQNHNINVQGTSGKTNYYLSFGYNSQQGIMNFNPDKLKKYNASVNITTQLKDWLEVGARINYIRKEYTKPDTWNYTYQYLWRWGSFFGPYGTINGHDFRVISMQKQAATKTTTTDITRMNTFLKADIIKGLTLNADFTYEIQNMNSGSSDFPVFGMNNWASIKEPSYIVNKGSTNAWRDNSKTNTWTTNIYASYNKTFAQDHNLTVMLGGNAESTRYDYFYAYRNGLLDTSLPEIDLTTGDKKEVKGNATHRTSAGYFGRINYDYKGIYLLELNGRYDGSSRFPRNDHWAFFPSASVGYRFSQEAYFDNLRHIINNAKLRASYGEIGNEAVGDYMFIPVITTVSQNEDTGYTHWLNSAGNGLITQANMPKLVSSALTWERIRTIDVGIDLGFLNNELTVGVDWFQRENRDMLAPARTFPETLGTTAPYENAGTLRSRGWEVSLNWNHRFNDVEVYANFNIGDSKTTITQWNNDSKLLNTYYSGKVYGDIWGFETERYFTPDDFNADGSYKKGVADQTGLQTDNFVYGPGDIKFKDLNGDGKIDGGKGTADDHGDLKVIGNNMPRYEYSFHIGGAWKGFDLDLFFQGVGKRENWTQSAFAFPMMRAADISIYGNQTSYNSYDYATGQWNINQGNDFPRLYPGNEGKGTVSGIEDGCHNYYPQDKYLVDMSYLRLKNVTLGYTIPQHLTRKAYIEKARVYFSGSNLFLLHKGSNLPVDPEVDEGYGKLSYGTWGRTEPITRTFSFGLQVTF